MPRRLTSPRRLAPRAARALRAPGAPRRPPATSPRHAFTLVEVVVALVLLATAALHVAATSTYLARLAASARAQALATRTAAHLVDSLRTIPCASLAAGAVATIAGTVRWTVTSGTGTRDLRVVLTPVSPRARQPVVEEVLLPCD